MLATIDVIRKEATQQLDQGKRSALGQFMTPGIIAKFMASLLQKNDKKAMHLLDAGAGVGSLTGAVLDRKLEGWGKAKNIQVTAYDLDASLLHYLKQNLAEYTTLLSKKNLVLNSIVLNADFIEDAVLRIKNGERPFTHAILNPPYKKIHSTSTHRQTLRSIGFETVNLYPAFVALSLHLLADKGELVAIIPRSFCNGNYYRAFRNFITAAAAIKRIHLFDARNKAFSEDAVLQENIIIHLVKGERQGKVIVSRSTDQSLEDLTEQSYPYKQIVKPGDSEAFIHIPGKGQNHIEQSEAFEYSLSDLGLTVSTGPVVDFRSKEHIFRDPGEGMIPLLYPMHFNGKEIDWPKAGKKPNAIMLNAETKKMLFPSGYYTVVRRFSSKEEKQRIVARVINPEKIDAEFIGIENHLNVIHSGKKGIQADLAYGIAAYLNSSFVDTHFRSFNGHTQVNATDLKQMRYPSLDALVTLGKWAKKIESFDQEIIDKKIQAIIT